MICYKSSIQERPSPLGAKMGRGSPVCQQMPVKTLLCQKEALCLPCPEAPSTSLGLEATGLDHHTEQTCIEVRQITMSGLFWTLCAPDHRRKGPSRLLPAT